MKKVILNFTGYLVAILFVFVGWPMMLGCAISEKTSKSLPEKIGYFAFWVWGAALLIGIISMRFWGHP